MLAVEDKLYPELRPDRSRISRCNGEGLCFPWRKRRGQAQQLKGAGSPDGFLRLSHHSCIDRKLSLGLNNAVLFSRDDI